MKRIINTLLLLSVAIIAMAQTSFVVADKNGNSQLVQSLVFQQQQTSDRFSWKSDGSATGDINDLLFIARAKNQLSTANTEDVTKMLEELSGTDLADAEAIATALKTNPNVEEAYTADGANLIVTTKDEGYHVVYPMYDANYVFVNDEIAASLSKRLNSIMRKQPRKAAGTNGKIAIFNFYDGFDSWYKTQNAIIKAIEKMFEDHDFYVENYGDGSNGLLFTEGNLKDVVRRSSEYKAIIIMGHGGARWTDVNDYNNQYPDVAKKKRHVIATKQQCYFGTGGDPNNEYVFREEADDKYYYMMDCELEVTGDCILYDGTCFSAPTSGYSTESDVYPNVSQSVVLGWNGFNRMSQAHAALLFYRMLYERFDLKDAITLTFQQDPSYGSFYLVKDSYDEEADRYDRDNSKLFYSKYVGKQKLQGKSSLQKQFTQNASITLDSPGDKTVQDTGDDKMRVSGKLWGNLGDKPNLTIELHPIYGYGTKTVYTAASKPLGADYYMFSVSVPLVSEGIYDIIIRTLDNSSSQSEIIMLKAPQAVIYSGYFRKNCALPVIDDEDSRTPIIYNEKDETVAEITIPAGTSQTYQIDAYPGHTFETPCLDKSVCNVSVSGNTLTVKGLKEGSTIFGVFDVQNRQMAVVRVTVTADGGVGSTFTALTKEGVEVTYKVLSSSEKTCIVGEDDWGKVAIDKSTSGSLTIPENVQGFTVVAVGACAFYDCKQLTKVFMPQSIKEIHHDAFGGCINLISADIPSSVTEIGYQAFVSCHSLSSVTIPSGVTVLEYNTFAGTAISTITIPESVTKIYGSALACGNLTSVFIPASVIEIANPFTRQGILLTSISVAIDNPVYHSDGNCIIETATNRLVVGLKTSVIPSYVKILGSSSFACCLFTEFEVPEGIISMEESTLNSNWYLTKLILPSTLTSMDEYAVYSCDKLTTVVAKMRDPFPLGKSFMNNKALKTLYVPIGCKEKYEATEGWDIFENIVEIEL